eukprot:TRINITY_DN27161_c0_g1_i1.p1 TRINITY_DN27161_c0_g1~~TRINITY_DN27161_c0_g1_i1.p1  ORF type:complete len:121 (-),score=0.35 TRINITY_DN27161_c0_g1_i1:1170-1532(-)
MAGGTLRCCLQHIAIKHQSQKPEDRSKHYIKQSKYGFCNTNLGRLSCFKVITAKALMYCALDVRRLKGGSDCTNRERIFLNVQHERQLHMSDSAEESALTSDQRMIAEISYRFDHVGDCQ